MKSFSERHREKYADVVRTREDMHAYQADLALPFVYENPFSALFIDMGLGKTIIMLTLIVDLLNDWMEGKVLIIGPVRVVTDTWPSEIGQWQHTAHLSHTVIRVEEDDPRLAAIGKKARDRARQAGGSAQTIAAAERAARTLGKQRLLRQAISQPTAIHLVNRESLDAFVNFFEEERNWPYRTVIIDESSSFRDHASSRFKALAKVRQGKGHITRLHCLTATPCTEGYIGLFPQMYFLDLGERLGKNITRYRESYFRQNPYSRKWEELPGAQDKITEKIADITMVLKAEDYLDLEKPFFVERQVTLSQKQRDLYDTMMKDFIVTLDDGTEIEAETAAALSSKLLQMASGVLYETFETKDEDTDDMIKVKKVHRLHEHKMEMLHTVVEELGKEPIIVAYHFKSSLARLKKEFPKAVQMDREGKCIKAWNKGKIPMLLIHPASAGHGLNLQAGGHNIVFFDIPWSLELFQQTVGRLARQGQKHVVKITLLICVGTIDARVWQMLQAKDDVQNKLFAMLKRKIAALRKKRAAKLAIEIADTLDVFEDY